MLQSPVDAGDDGRLDVGQDIGQQRQVDARGTGEGEDGAEVEADRNGTGNPNLVGGAVNDPPDGEAGGSLRLVQAPRALGTDAVASAAVICTPAEVPGGEGDDAFFSASSVRAGPMTRTSNASSSG